MEKMFGVDSMPETAENVAEQFAISREDQDAFALRSQERAAAAIAEGWFKDEILAVEIPQRKGEPIIVETDEHPRATTLAQLASLPTPFRPDGTVTAGNASGVNDGGRGLILATTVGIKAHGLTPLARIRGGRNCRRASAPYGDRPCARDRKALCSARPFNP